MKNTNKVIGISLFIGSFLQIIRTMPVALSDGIKMLENFPPQNLEDTLRVADSSGWHISHIMVFLISPLLMIGFYGMYKLINKNEKSNVAIFALVVLGIGLLLYNIAAVIDGLFLPAVGHEFVESYGNAKEHWGALVTYTHELAVNFGGIAFAHLLLGSGLLALGLNKLKGFKAFSIVGMVIGALALIGYLTGILDLMFTGSFVLTGGITMIMFIYFFVLGIKVYRLDNY